VYLKEEGTNGPKSYCIRVVRHFAWTIDDMVCYHDTRNHKPDPEPIIKSLELLGAKNSQAVSVGDDAMDIIASRRAGVHSIAATWGAYDVESLIHAGPDEICNSVTELKQLLRVRFD
jgi:phosphoglycolate phosphatase-like HAD superfamily hydrolase